MEEKFVDMAIQFKITGRDIDDIMTGALEGGIPYWCRKVKVVGDYRGKYASEQISRGGKLLLYSYEEKTPYCLDMEKLLNGIKLWVEKPVSYNCLEYIDGKLVIDCSNADAEVCDTIIQYALFGDVIYG